jgi:hypothetical protein
METNPAPAHYEAERSVGDGAPRSGSLGDVLRKRPAVTLGIHAEYCRSPNGMFAGGARTFAPKSIARS